MFVLVFQSHIGAQENEKKPQESEDALEQELNGLEEDDFPDLVPSDDQGELMDELSTLEDDDFPDLVSVNESGELMDELAFLEDAGMVEVAARHRQLIGMSPSAITVITREDLECSGATSITDLLRLVPGMEIVVMSPLYHSVTGRVLWNPENNTHQVRIDDRMVNLEVLGYPPWTVLPITVNDIERIEVIRGPGRRCTEPGPWPGSSASPPAP